MPWQLAATLAVGSGVMAAGQQRAAGQAARSEARLQAIEIRKQRFGIEEIALQQQQQLFANFSELINTNAAVAAYMGRTDRSIRAIQKQEAEKYSTDVRRVQSQKRREIDKLGSQALTMERRGDTAREVASYNANATLFSSFGSAAMIYGLGS